MALALGVDIGGTKIAFALVDEGGNVQATHRLPTLPDEGAEAVFERIASGIQQLLDQASGPVLGAGIGSPGQLNPHTGIVHNATNLHWLDVPLLDGVRARLSVDLPLWLHKDANAAALGEMYFGAACSVQDFVYLSVGTGLGGGAVLGGEIVLGSTFGAMEIGHMPLLPGGRLCNCGARGCPEMYISGNGLLAGVTEHLPQYPDSVLAQLETVTTSAVLEAARAGDALAVAVIDEAAEWLTSVMVACAGVLNPSRFVIGGGLGHAAWDLLAERAQQGLARRLPPGLFPEMRIVESQVTSSAVGAACLVWHALASQRNSHDG